KEIELSRSGEGKHPFPFTRCPFPVRLWRVATRPTIPYNSPLARSAVALPVGFWPTFSFARERVLKGAGALDEGGSVEAGVRAIAERAARERGLELVHVELAGGARAPIVRVFIDRPGGVTHEDCSV